MREVRIIRSSQKNIPKKQHQLIVINIYPKRDGDRHRPLIALIPLAYSYRNNLKTEAGKVRGEDYRELKNRVEKIILSRMMDHLGSDFIGALEHHELSTPITYERYTYSQQGSFMGWVRRRERVWKILEAKNRYKKFIPSWTMGISRLWCSRGDGQRLLFG